MSTRKILGWTLIADGAIGLLWPTRYLRLLEVGPAPVSRFLETMARRPDATRVACVGEILAGALLARSGAR